MTITPVFDGGTRTEVRDGVINGNINPGGRPPTIVPCGWCGQPFAIAKLRAHLAVCPKKPAVPEKGLSRPEPKEKRESEMKHRHNWKPLGGCNENPGCFDRGNGNMIFPSLCNCGKVRVKGVNYASHSRGDVGWKRIFASLHDYMREIWGAKV